MVDRVTGLSPQHSASVHVLIPPGQVFVSTRVPDEHPWSSSRQVTAEDDREGAGGHSMRCEGNVAHQERSFAHG